MARRHRAGADDRAAEELRDRILGSNPHVYVWKHGGIADYHAEVGQAAAGAARRRRGAGDPRQGADVAPARTQPFITIKGIDPALEPQRHRHRRRRCSSGSLDALTPREPTTSSPASCSARIWRRKLGVDGRRLGARC